MLVGCPCYTKSNQVEASFEKFWKMLMLTDDIEKLINWRLGNIAKYTFTGCLGFDSCSKRFIQYHGYRSLNWKLIEGVGYLVPLSVGLLIYTELGTQSIQENGAVENKNLLIVLAASLFFTLMSVVMAFSSLQIDYKQEIVESFNQPFSVNRRFKKQLFPKSLQIPMEAAAGTEQLFKNFCYGSLFIPICLILSLFHPADPIHNILESFLEAKVEINLGIGVFLIIETFGVLCYTQTAIVFILSFLISTSLSEYWLYVSKPTGAMALNKRRMSSFKFRTLKMTVASEDVMIWIYRTLQCVVANTNVFLESGRCVAHAQGILASWVVSTFSLLKYYQILIDGGAVGLSLMTVLTGVCLIVPLLYYLECSILDRLEVSCQHWKQTVIKLTPRNSAIHKTAVSLRVITLKTGGSFFNVNQSTFMDWKDACLVNLVNLLVYYNSL